MGKVTYAGPTEGWLGALQEKHRNGDFVQTRRSMMRPVGQAYKTNRSAVLAEWQSLMARPVRDQGKVAAIGDLLQLV